MRFEGIMGRVLLVGVLTTVLGASVAATGASAQAPAKRAKQSVAKQVKALKKQTAALAKQVAALTGVNAGLAKQVGALTGANTELERKLALLSSDTALFGTKLLDLETKGPLGPAGGSLAGEYPDPVLDLGTVGTGNIINGSIIGSDISRGAIGGEQLKRTFRVAADLGTVIKEGAQGISTATCPDNSRLLSGGYEWEHNEPAFRDVRVDVSRAFTEVTWQVRGEVVNGPNNSLIATAFCLER